MHEYTIQLAEDSIGLRICNHVLSMYFFSVRLRLHWSIYRNNLNDEVNIYSHDRTFYRNLDPIKKILLHIFINPKKDPST